jgi:hypothetical protein
MESSIKLEVPSTQPLKLVNLFVGFWWPFQLILTLSSSCSLGIGAVGWEEHLVDKMKHSKWPETGCLQGEFVNLFFFGSEFQVLEHDSILHKQICSLWSYDNFPHNVRFACMRIFSYWTVLIKAPIQNLKLKYDRRWHKSELNSYKSDVED